MASAAAAAAAIVLLPGRQTLPATMMSFSRRLNGPVFRSVTSCSYSTSFASRKQLILYSKPGCCLCDGLKEKLHSAFSLASPSPDSYSLHDVELQEIIPRFSPRAGVDHIQTKLAAALSKDN
ncbi:uncharacterized protein LOC112514397 isoform X2 [Cynara cardunculus var. scolymus]|uniref:uncharacterized protein LOC112514397 isoform X2 n=1 Tax=Cynara cardunculus var. scolymus TaxID=59895 RepID=UPI000D62C801|nr:uncharacterized protein LOC112514397 isoform X2 [Cynara cardunculus var. scolymus]